MLHVHLNRTIERIVVFSWLFAHTGLSLWFQSVSYEFEEFHLPPVIEGFTGSNIIQDRDGFIWIGSNKGLFRFDGSDFKQYSLELKGDITTIKKSSGLVGGFVYSLKEDDAGVLWFINRFVLTRFDRQTESFRYYNDPRFSSQIYMASAVDQPAS